MWISSARVHEEHRSMWAAISAGHCELSTEPHASSRSIAVHSGSSAVAIVAPLLQVAVDDLARLNHPRLERVHADVGRLGDFLEGESLDSKQYDFALGR